VHGMAEQARTNGNEYQVHPGTNIISSPGKFEGEPSWLPALLSEQADEEIYDAGNWIGVFMLDEEIKAHIGSDAEGYDAVVVWETEQGFVGQRLLTMAELDTFRAACEQDAAVEED
jgi:hypothetical protein